MHTRSNDYSRIGGGAPVYIRIDSIDTGSFKLQEKNTIVATCGPAACYRNFSHEIPATTKNPKLAWGFKYNNADNSSFVIALYKKCMLFDDLIGMVYVRLSEFAANEVYTKELQLRNHKDEPTDAKIKISVHLDDNGSPAFRPIKHEAKIPHKTTALAMSSVSI